MKIKDTPKIDRPREKLKQKGAAALQKAELLAIILRTGIKNKNVIKVAEDILKKYSDKKLTDATYQELKNIHGVGPTKAAQIIAAIALGQRLFKEKSREEIFINSPQDIIKAIGGIKENKKENFIALYLDARNKLIYQETISIGTLNANLVHPRELFEPAVRNFAASIIIAHNHPTGAPEPSQDDLDITKQLVQAGKIMGIEVIDHLIIGENAFLSFKEKNLL